MANKTALLVTDAINFCCHPKCEIRKYGITFNRIRKMVPKLVKFIEKYKKSGGLVVYTKCVPWNKENLAGNIVELYKDPRCMYYSKDKTGFGESFYLAKPGKNDFVVTKDTYDAFANPELDKLLKKKGIKNLVVTGVFGDGCVHATIQGGFSKGYNFTILKDLVETTDKKVRQDLQKLLKKYTWPIMFGKTISSSVFLKNIKA